MKFDKNTARVFLSAILPLSKVKPKLEYSVLKLVTKSMSMRYVPLSIDYFESNILEVK